MLAGRHPYGRRGRTRRATPASKSNVFPACPCAMGARWRRGLGWRRGDRPGVRELLRDLDADAPAPGAGAGRGAFFPFTSSQGDLLRRPGRRWRAPAVIGLAIALGVLIGRFAFDSRSDAGIGSSLAWPPVDSRDSNAAAAPATGSSAEHALPRYWPAVPPPIRRLRTPAPNEGEVIGPGWLHSTSGTMSVSEPRRRRTDSPATFGQRRTRNVVGRLARAGWLGSCRS